MNPLISVIVPIYNCSSFLYSCFESLQKQSYSNFEVVLVNDGSTDNSCSICENICAIDSRFILYSTQNNGVSSARNYGIKMCRGDLICFVDADDYIETDFLDELVKAVQNVDIAFCRFFIEEDSQIKYFETNLARLCEKPNAVELFIFDELYNLRENVLFRDCIFGACWRSIFRKDIIFKNSLSFNGKLSLGEDLVFVMSYLLCCSKCHIVDKYLYHYVMRSNSATDTKTRGFNPNFWNTYYPLFLEEKRLFQERLDPNKQKDIINYLTFQFLYRFTINECVLNKATDHKSLKRIIKSNNLNFSTRTLFKNHKLSLRKKILILLIKLHLFSLITHILVK